MPSLQALKQHRLQHLLWVAALCALLLPVAGLIKQSQHVGLLQMVCTTQGMKALPAPSDQAHGACHLCCFGGMSAAPALAFENYLQPQIAVLNVFMAATPLFFRNAALHAPPRGPPLLS